MIKQHVLGEGVVYGGKIVCVEVTHDTSLCVVPMKFPRTLVDNKRIGAPLTAMGMW